MNDWLGAAQPPHNATIGKSPGFAFAADDGRRRQELQGRRRVASGLLICMAGGFLLTLPFVVISFWISLVRYSLAGGLAGGLAVWFAVTALLRRPLGLPIPHTAIVEQLRDRFASGIGDFVERNFLTPASIAAGVRSFGPAARIGTYLARGDNAQRMATRLAASTPGMLSALEDRGLTDLAAGILGSELEKIDLGPFLGHTMRAFSGSRQADVLFDRMLDGLLDVVFDNAERINLAVERQNEWWMPRAFDRRITNAILIALEDFVADLRTPDSPRRLSIRTGIEEMAQNLIASPEHRAEVSSLSRRLIADPDVQSWLNTIWHHLRDAASEAGGSERAASQGQPGIAATLETCGRALNTDARLRQELDELVGSMIARAVAHFRGEIDVILSDAARTWDAQTMADRVELTIGPNLQSIRINGTVLGALAGCLLFLLSWLVSY